MESVNVIDPPSRDASWAESVRTDYVIVKFGDGVAMRIMETNLSSEYDNRLAKFWKTNTSGFPGSLAVSILRSDLNTLKTKKYHILPKSDGIRYILFAAKKDNGSRIVDMFERTACHFAIMLEFEKKVFDGTILDGELVQTRQGSYEYQVFDCMASCGELIPHLPYSQRMARARKVVESMYKYECLS